MGHGMPTSLSFSKLPTNIIIELRRKGHSSGWKVRMRYRNRDFSLLLFRDGEVSAPLIGTDGGAVDESHAERKVAPLDEFEQALPHALMRRADETTAPLAVRSRTPPGSYANWPRSGAARRSPRGLPQILGWRLAVRPDSLYQRFPRSPRRRSENLISMFLRYLHNTG